MGAPYALSSDLVSAWPAKSLEVAQYIDGQLPLIAMTQNAQTGTTYTLAATDFTKLVTLSNASPVTVTVPLESSVPWVAGTQLRLMNLGAGVVTVAGAVGVTINGSPLTLAQYKQGTLTKTGTNTWTFVGSPSAPGMDLITPTSVAGSGVTLSGGQINIAAATTISVNGCFSAAYDTYQIVLYMTTGGTGAVSMRLRVSAADNSTANYNAQRMGVTGGTTAVLSRSTGATSWFAFTPSTSLQGMRIDLYRPFLAATTFGLVSMARGTDSNIDIDNYSLGHNTATSFDGFTIDPGSAATGTMRVYGLRTS